MAEGTKQGIEMQIAGLIKQAREKKGLSQTELAELLGVTRATVNGYESGKHNPTVSTLQKVAKVLGVELEIKLG